MITANELVENINPLVFLITPWLVNALARLFRDPMRPIKCSASAAGSPIRFVSLPTRQRTHIYSQSSSIDFIILDLYISSRVSLYSRLFSSPNRNIKLADFVLLIGLLLKVSFEVTTYVHTFVWTCLKTANTILLYYRMTGVYVLISEFEWSLSNPYFFLHSRSVSFFLQYLVHKKTRDAYKKCLCCNVKLCTF